MMKFVNSDWLLQNFPCREACPVHTEAGRYVNLIAQGRYKEAYHVARQPNPFASICGRICGAPCEDTCRRGKIDAPIAIRALKRFVCERYGVESLLDWERFREVLSPASSRRPERVAIIGAGPAGLSCAHDLALLGYQVTVFEAQPVAGGMLRLGIPEYRLPRELLRFEINAILSLGVDLKLNARLGRDFSLGDLWEQDFDAIFLGIGAHKSRDLQIEGVELDGVLRAIDFLLNVNFGYRVNVGDRVIVIGGGNVAVDVARAAVRQERPEVVAHNLTEAFDAARSAIRFGAKEVHMVCLESREEMPATEEEIAGALEERVQIHCSKGPKRILGHQGKVIGLETIDCTSVFDANGHFNPTFAPSTEQVMDADTIIMAIGQTVDLSFLTHKDGIEVTPRGTIKVDPETLATTAPGVYTGGDAAFGPRLAIHAIADGRRAARSIYTYLRDEVVHQHDFEILVYDRQNYAQEEDFERIPRQPIPHLPIDRRIGIAAVELGYDEETAIREARRCLRCWINTIFEGREEFGSECILCGGCADICPESCIELVASERVDLTGVESDISKPVSTVIIKDEEKCIRCGLCARRCPVGCITMEGFEFFERVAV